jgi:multicomponent Na+:H+ antiporter subunit G
VTEPAASILIGLGVACFAAGGLGLLRFPDLLCRLHALTKADNLGLGLISAGLALAGGSAGLALKLGLIWLLVLAASAASSHLIARQALRQERDP